MTDGIGHFGLQTYKLLVLGIIPQGVSGQTNIVSNAGSGEAISPYRINNRARHSRAAA